MTIYIRSGKWFKPSIGHRFSWWPFHVLTKNNCIFLKGYRWNPNYFFIFLKHLLSCLLWFLIYYHVFSIFPWGFLKNGTGSCPINYVYGTQYSYSLHTTPGAVRKTKVMLNNIKNTPQTSQLYWALQKMPRILKSYYHYETGHKLI